MNKTEHMPHVESASLVAPDAITWPQGHREEADCRFGKFNKKSKSYPPKCDGYGNFATYIWN